MMSGAAASELAGWDDCEQDLKERFGSILMPLAADATALRPAEQPINVAEKRGDRHRSESLQPAGTVQRVIHLRLTKHLPLAVKYQPELAEHPVRRFVLRRHHPHNPVQASRAEAIGERGDAALHRIATSP